MYQPLKTDRLLLRKVEEQDLTFIHCGLSDKKVTQYMLIHYPTLESAREQLHYYYEQYASNNGYYWVMELQSSQTPIGIIGITNIKMEHRRAELGYWLLPEFQQLGYTTEAGKKILSYCFTILGLNRVEAETETENCGSIRALEKLGFQKEGVFKEYEINKGRLIDLARYALLKKDYLTDDNQTSSF